MVEARSEHYDENDPSHGRGRGPERHHLSAEEEAQREQEAGEVEVRRGTRARLEELSRNIETTDKDQINNFVENLIEKWKTEYGWKGSTEEILAKIRGANPDVKFVKVTESIQQKMWEEAVAKARASDQGKTSGIEEKPIRDKIKKQWPLGKHYIIAQKGVFLKLPGELWPEAAEAEAEAPAPAPSSEPSAPAPERTPEPSSGDASAAPVAEHIPRETVTRHADRTIRIEDLHRDAVVREVIAQDTRESRRRDQARIRETEAALETRPFDRQRALAGADVNLDRREFFQLDSSLKPLYEAKNWDEWQTEWTFTKGHSGVESLFNNSITFKTQGFHLKQLWGVMKLDQNRQKLDFSHLMMSVYSRGPAIVDSIDTILSAQGKPTLDKKDSKHIHGLSFTQDYARLLKNGAPESVLNAYRQIYLDVTELYEMLKLLRYEPGQLAQPTEATETPELPEGAQQFATFLDGVFNTKDAREGIRRYRSRAQEQPLTYADIESGDAASLRNRRFRRALAEQFDPQSIITDLYASQVREKFEREKRTITFNEGETLAFLNRLIEAGLRQKLIREGWGNDELENRVQGTMPTYQLNNLEGTTPTQAELLRDGYFEYALLRHAEQTASGRHWRTERTSENEEAIRNGTPVRLDFPADFGAGLIDSLNAQGVTLTTGDRAKIQEHLAAGLMLGFLQQASTGEVSLNRVGVGVSSPPLRLSNGRTLSADGGLLFNSENPENPVIGGQVNMGKSFPNGVQLNFRFGGGAALDKGPMVSVGVGLKLPLGPNGPLALHAQAGVAVLPGVLVVEAGVGIGWNSEGAYKTGLDRKFKKLGFTGIEAAFSEGKSRAEIARLILANPTFKSLGASAETLGKNLGKTIEAEDFYQFAIDVYKARRYEISTTILDKSTPPPIPVLPTHVGVKLIIIITPTGAVPIPVPYITVTVAKTKLVYRTVTGLPYHAISDAQILQSFDQQFDTFYPADEQQQIQIAPLQPGEGGQLMLMDNGDGFEATGEKRDMLDELNASANTIGVNFKKTELPGRGDNAGKTFELLEMEIANVPGNLDILLDPELGDSVQLLYENGKTYLAIEPGAIVHFKRQNFYFPFKKDGEYVRTVLTITKNPVVTLGQLADLERVPFLHQQKGYEPVEDYALALDASGVPMEPTSNNIRTLEEYLSGTMAQEHMAYAIEGEIKDEIAEIEAARKTAMDSLGTINVGEAIDPMVRTRLKGEAEKIAGDPKTTTDRAFLTRFKELSTYGEENFNLDELRRLCADKGKFILGRPLQGNELHYFMQMLNIYSMVEWNVDKLGDQKVPHEAFVRRALTDIFTDKGYGADAAAMTERIIEDLGRDLNLKTPTRFETIPGGVFGSLVGSDHVEGLRVLEEYREDEVYNILNRVHYDLDSSDPTEQLIAQAIIVILNPVPFVDVRQLTLESLNNRETTEALQTFLRDDFSQRIAMAWFYRDIDQAQALTDLIQDSKLNDARNLRANLEANPSRIELLKTFYDFIQRARQIEATPNPDPDQKRRIPLDTDDAATATYFLTFEDISTSFGIFERCGNVSLFLDEKIGIERVIQGENRVVALEDNNYRMVQTQAAVESVGIGLGGNVEVISDSLIRNETVEADKGQGPSDGGNEGVDRPIE